MNRDLFNNAQVRDVSNASMAVITTIQDMQPHVQMAALAATFLLLSDHWKVAPQEAFAAVKNLMNHAEGRRPEFNAVAAYMEAEL